MPADASVLKWPRRAFIDFSVCSGPRSMNAVTNASLDDLARFDSMGACKSAGVENDCIDHRNNVNVHNATTPRMATAMDGVAVLVCCYKGIEWNWECCSQYTSVKQPSMMSRTRVRRVYPMKNCLNPCIKYQLVSGFAQVGQPFETQIRITLLGTTPANGLPLAADLDQRPLAHFQTPIASFYLTNLKVCKKGANVVPSLNDLPSP